MAPIVIIGSGLAGYNVAREFRKLDKDSPLSVITSDGGAFYSKPTLSNALALRKSADAIPLNTPEQMAAQLNATVRCRTRITAIATDRHEVRIGNEALHYSKLVLALGADQIKLPLAGDAVAAVMSVNGLDDYTRFRTEIEGKRGVVVIGAGLIGCEFANDLCTAGYNVDVVDIAAQPLPRLLPAAGAALLQDRLAA